MKNGKFDLFRIGARLNLKIQLFSPWDQLSQFIRFLMDVYENFRSKTSWEQELHIVL